MFVRHWLILSILFKKRKIRFKAQIILGNMRIKRHEFFLEVIDELDSIQQTYDLDNCPKQPSSKTSDLFQFIDNSLFEVGAVWISDNPLFEVEERVPLDFLEEDDLDFRDSDQAIVLNNEPWSQDWCGEVTTTTPLSFNLYMVLNSNLYIGWMDFLF